MSGELEKIVNECMDSAGYFICAGMLTKELDAEGNRVLRFVYRRYQMATDDVKDTIKNGIKELKADIDRDFRRSFDGDQEEENKEQSSQE